MSSAVPHASPQKSTIVRSVGAPRLLRWGFSMGSWVMPGATVRHASRLFSTPLPTSRSRALADRCSDAAVGQVISEGEGITTYAWGEPACQPCVVLAHGWSSYGLRFRPWVEPLRAAGYAVVAFDQPAHGRNTGGRPLLPAFAAALAAVVRRYGPPAAVVAHSMGGASTLLALASGVRTSRTVLLAPVADLRAAGARFGQAVGLAPTLVGRMLEGFERQAGVQVDSFAAHLHAPAMGIPALVVHDIGDHDVPWEEGERYARLWPDARLLTTSGLGHHRVASDPAVIDAALRFLQGEAVGERVVSSPNLRFGFE